MPKIHVNRLKTIVRQEVLRHKMLHENEERKVALDHADAAAKCLDAIEKYKETSSAKAMGEMEDALGSVEKVLNRIVASPLEYADVMSSDYQDTSGDIEIVDDESPPQKKRIKPSIV